MSEDTLRETFCKNLSRILKERKMTQRDFAKAVGVSAATANEWLKGKKMPLMGRIDTICSVLSIDRSDLMAAPAAAPPPGLTARDERDIERFDPVKAIFDDSDVRSLARDRLKGVSKEEIALKKQQLKAMVAAMWMKEENEK